MAISTPASVPRQRWTRIIPVAFLMYTIAFMDRINVGFGFSGMEKSLHINATVAGLAGGIFFFGYLFLQIPGGHLATKWSAKKFVLGALMVWGVFAILTGLVQNTTELLIVRFLLGVAEGGVWPATLVLLAKWFPLEERARANSYWMFCLPVAAIVISPISGWILTFSTWHTLFILEGIPPFLWALIWWLFVDESPDTAKWISPAEREYLHQKFEQDRKAVKPEAGGSWAAGLKNSKIWRLVLVYFLVQVGFYGIALWMPTMIQGLTKQGFGIVGLVSALPYVAAVIGLYLNANHSDKTGERNRHVAIPLIAGGVALLLSGLLGTPSPLVGILFLILAEGFMLPYVGVFWTLPPMLLDSVSTGPAMGLINALGNLGGFFGPFLVGFLITATGSDLFGIVMMFVALVVAGVIVLGFQHQGQVPAAATLAQ